MGLEMSHYLQRRINLLITECQINPPCYDDVVKGAMYTISHFATVGKLTLSKPTKRMNKNISVEAKLLRKNLQQQDANRWFETFHKMTTNEHQLPLKDMWLYFCTHKDILTPELVWATFCKYPYVTITKEENKRLPRNLRKNINQTPEQRYKEAGIEIIFDLGD